MAEKRTLEDLAKLGNPELMQVFAEGKTPEWDQLRGFEFRGFNVGTPPKLLGIQKFKKGFFNKSDQPFGYNIPVMQNGLYGKWISKPHDENPKRFGWYSVGPVDPNAKENKEPHAFLINYHDGNNPLHDGSWILRDYIVQVDHDNPDLYLGKAFLALGPARVFSNFFIIERHKQSALK